MKITDFKIQFKDMDTAIRATKMFELRRQISRSALNGKLHEARKYQKELAHEAVNDFETYTKLPILNIHAPSIPAKSVLSLLFRSLKSKLFYTLSPKTAEEKQFNQMCKEYFSKLTPEERKAKTIDYTIPSLF